MSHLPSTRASLGSKEKALIKSAKAGDSKKIRELIEKGADVNCGDTVGHDSNITPLMYAAEAGHQNVVELLLRANANVHARDKSAAMRGGDGTALHYALQVHAAGKPDTAILELLLTAGADPNARLANGYTALDWASSSGYLDAVKLLLQHGGDTNASSDRESSPALMAASGNGHFGVAKALIAAGAKVAGVSDYGGTALMAAADGGHVEIVALLLKKKVDPNLRTTRGETSLTLAANRLGDCCEEEGGNRFLAVVKLLVKAGADLNVRAPNGWTPLDFVEYNPMKDHPYYGPRWFGKGGDYLRKMGAKRACELE